MSKKIACGAKVYLWFKIKNLHDVHQFFLAGSRDGCRHSIAESTVDVPIRLLRQIFSVRTVFFSHPFAQSAAYIWFPLDFCKPFGHWNDPCNCHSMIYCRLCLKGTRRWFKYFPKNALLSFCRNMKSAVHMPYAGWLILSCYALAERLNSQAQFQQKSVINPSVLLQDLHHALVRYLISLLVCAVLYVITVTPSLISSPECADLSPNTCKLFAYFQIWNSLIRQNIVSLIRWFFSRCDFTLTKKVAVPAAILFCSISMAAAKISASGAPTNIAFPPSPIHDDDCFYYHSWRNNVVIAFGTLSSFLT